jgi:NADPH:quinone reductase-like Zn-dependent oxidoreductase
MKAVGLYKHLPIEDPQSLVDLDIQQPKHPTGHDLLLSIKAISVNPLDSKVRRGTIRPPENENVPRILGWDAAGEVIAVGSDFFRKAMPSTMLEVFLDQGQTANFSL